MNFVAFLRFRLNNMNLYDCGYVILCIFCIEFLSIKGFLDYYPSKYLFWLQYVFIAAFSSENFFCTKVIHYFHPTVRYSAIFSHLQWNFWKGLPITNITVERKWRHIYRPSTLIFLVRSWANHLFRKKT